jgi:superfamily II DNA or RNA helicase
MPVSVITTEQSAGAESASGLRGWQQRALAQMQSWSEGSFLISAAPGAGKTRAANSNAGRLTVS